MAPPMRPSRGSAAAALPAKKKTIVDAKMASAVAMAKASTVLTKANLALDNAMEVIDDETASKSRKRKARKEIGTIKAYLKKVSNNMNKDARTLSPLPHLGYAIGRLSKAQKIADKSPFESSPINSVAAALEDEGNGKRASMTTRLSPVRSAKRKAELPTHSRAPVPRNGKIYERKEFLEHFYSNPRKSPARGAFMRESVTKKYVPLSLSGLHKAVAHFERHLKADTANSLENYKEFPWKTGSGAKPLLEIEDLTEMAKENLVTRNGSSLHTKELSDLIVAKQLERAMMS